LDDAKTKQLANMVRTSPKSGRQQMAQTSAGADGRKGRTRVRQMKGIPDAVAEKGGG
jgi:hypothetical protein